MDWKEIKITKLDSGDVIHLIDLHRKALTRRVRGEVVDVSRGISYVKCVTILRVNLAQRAS